MDAWRSESRKRPTWGASAGLGDGEFLMRGTTITTGLPGKDGRLCKSLRKTERQKDSRLVRNSAYIAYSGRGKHVLRKTYPHSLSGT